MSNEKLAWGILGTGNIARKFCSGLISSNFGFPAAVGSRNEQSAAEFSERFAISRFYPAYAEVIEDPHIDAVYISLPNSLHYEWTIRALHAGKHVLCEKPIALSAPEAEAMFEAARFARRVLIEGFMYRAHPLTREVVERVRMFAIGDVKLVRTSFCYQTNRVAGNVRFDSTLGGGALMDVGCYCINFSLMLAGSEPLDVAASRVMHANGIDELVAASMTFPNGLLAAFTCGMTVDADNSAYVSGTRGYIEIPRPWKPQTEGAKYRLAATLESPSVQEFTISPGVDLFALEADEFAMTVLRGQSPLVTPEESIATMRVLDQIRLGHPL